MEQKEILQELDEIREKAHALFSDFPNHAGSLERAQSYLSSMQEEYSENYDHIEDFLSEADALHSVNADVRTSKENFSEALTKIEEYKKEAQSAYNKIVAYHNELFGYQAEKEEKISRTVAAKLKRGAYTEREDGTCWITKKEHVPGIEWEVSEFLRDLNKIYDNYSESFKTKLAYFENTFTEAHGRYTEAYGKLHGQIEGLLSGATAAGISEAYAQAKSRQKIQIGLWTFLFLLALGGIAGSIAYLYLQGIYVISATMSPWDIAVQFLKVLPAELPLIWLGAVASKKINQHMRLHEEYLHKWSLARTFEGLCQKAESVQNDANKRLDEVFASFIQENAHNPSRTLDGVKSAASSAKTKPAPSLEEAKAAAEAAAAEAKAATAPSEQAPSEASRQEAPTVA